MTWRSATFRELFTVKHGYAFQGEFFDLAGEYILLTPGNFREEGGFRDQIDKRKYYTGEIPDDFILKRDDLLVVMTEQAPGLLGSSAWIPESRRFLHNQRLGLITQLRDLLIDKKFLYYLFNTVGVRHQISSSASGTKVRHTSPERIGRVTVALPPIVTQRRIAAILSAYDDLIENNRRRIQLLEQAAQLIYQEWFVRLRYPGHEHARVVDGVPEGWKRAPIGRLSTHLNRGISPSYNDDAEGLVINQKCIRARLLDMTKARRQERPFGPEKKVQVGDVLINSTGEGTLGRIAQVKAEIPNCTVDSHVTIVRPSSEIGWRYFGMALMELEPHFSVMGRGATNQTELSRATIADALLLAPTKPLVDSFEAIVAPISQQVLNLTEQISRLRQARDLLLPKLMSGEIEV